MLNEADSLPDLFEHLLFCQRQGCEVILVDGGSSDNSIALAKLAGFTVFEASQGRARQMNVGATAARGDILIFLHADTRLPVNADRIIIQALTDSRNGWGRFDITIEGRSLILKIISGLMNLRSRLSGIATGDQTIFVKRSLFEQVGGFPDQPLMEDIEISRRLKRLCRPVCLKDKVTTSGRRWESRGIWRTILLMWKLRLAYWLGIPPERLARVYQ
ncbi:MAG: TIGR04283 family arsenosugar biosynthesis glycosyltransferase [Gammaproteobacteria bacterium]